MKVIAIALVGITAFSALAWVSLPVAYSNGSDDAAFEACNQLAQSAVAQLTASAPESGLQQGFQHSPPAAPSRQTAESGSVAITEAPGHNPPGPLVNRSTPTPSATSDPYLRGMAQAGAAKPSYERIYAECMRGKLWSGT